MHTKIRKSERAQQPTQQINPAFAFQLSLCEAAARQVRHAYSVWVFYSRKGLRQPVSCRLSQPVSSVPKLLSHTFFSQSICAIISSALTSLSGWKDIYEAFIVSVSVFNQEVTLFVRTDLFSIRWLSRISAY